VFIVSAPIHKVRLIRHKERQLSDARMSITHFKEF